MPRKTSLSASSGSNEPVLKEFLQQVSEAVNIRLDLPLPNLLIFLLASSILREMISSVEVCSKNSIFAIVEVYIFPKPVSG